MSSLLKVTLNEAYWIVIYPKWGVGGIKYDYLYDKIYNLRNLNKKFLTIFAENKISEFYSVKNIYDYGLFHGIILPN